MYIFDFLILQQDVEKFSDIEKLYLYLKLPSGPSSNADKRWEYTCFLNAFVGKLGEKRFKKRIIQQ